MKIYIIIFLLVIIIILWFQKRSESFTNAEAVQNLARLYADASGTLIVNNIKSMNNISSNQIKVGNIDVSGNMDISGNIKIKGNIDISGTINGGSKEYLSASYGGKLTEAFFTAVKAGVDGNNYSSHFPILNRGFYTDFIINRNLQLDKSQAIQFDSVGGWFILNPNKLYRIEVHMQVNVWDTESQGDWFTARLIGKKPDNTDLELARADAVIYQDNVNIMLTTIAIASGYNKVYPTLQKYGDWNALSGTNTISIAVAIMEL